MALGFKVPYTQSVTSRGAKLMVDGKTLGLIQNFAMSQTRDVQRLFEINSDTDGDSVELVPGNISSIQLTIDTVELYTAPLEERFGIADASMLSKQVVPFEIHEYYTVPDANGNPAKTYGYIYEKCWFTDTGRTTTSDGSRLVQRNATIQATRIRMVTGITV